jgi:large subunit ribosomal protein L3
MGGERTTITNLVIIAADPERQLLLVKGAVPGSNGCTVIIRNSVKVATAKAKGGVR